VVVDVVNVTRGAGGDYDLFVDDDGQGYVVYSAAYFMSLEQLTPDFLSSTGKVATIVGQPSPGLFPNYFVEAPTFFKRNGTYYVLFGHCCCFCYQGSGLFVYTAPHPLGPWSAQAGGNIACGATSVPTSPHWMAGNWDGVGAMPTPGQGCQFANASQTSVTRSQQNFVIQVPTAGNNTLYIYTGDRWQQAPDGLKGHDPQYWMPLTFDASGNVLPLSWVDNFTFTVAA
jgi:beta-xylosidase